MTDWDSLTKPQLNDAVLEQTKALLNKAHASDRFTTAFVVEQLYPLEKAVYASQELTRSAIYNALATQALRELKAYCTKGEPISGTGRFSGKQVRPWEWHASKNYHTCEHCGQGYYR